MNDGIIRILVAEDDENSFLYILFALDENLYKIHRAKNGFEAIKLIESSDIQFDLILMDIRLPLIDGFAASKEIRRINPQIPIVMQTAYAPETIEQKLSEVRINGLLIKPYTANELGSTINSVLQHRNEF